MKVKVINKSNFPLPEYKTKGAAGVDLKANIEEEIVLKPLERKLIPTGLYVEIPEGYEGQVRPRSGLAINHGVTIINSPGTIDADYRGEVCLAVINLGSEDFVIKPGDRIAQLVLNKYERIDFELVDKLSDTERGKEGFGHTGV